MNPWAKAAVQGAACGLVFGLVVLIGGRLWWPQVAAAQAKPPAVPDEVKARRLEVVDAAGNGRASLFTAPDGSPVLDLSGAAGKTRVNLTTLRDDTPHLGLYDAAQKERLSLTVYRDGSGDVGVHDAAGNTGATLFADADGSPHVGLFNHAKQLVWQAP